MELQASSFPRLRVWLMMTEAHEWSVPVIKDCIPGVLLKHGLAS